ncbi:hypothetical protein [Bradyrhizobium sp. CCBAU 11445]|uniref:hypothetical protein n=1 Tax=Bradyrhizobium sp. CCBAU 11445 TaxID=1630896 RepID=UPI0023062BDA|nr:hypothetical protein [Bradyrhizobium sp. CCBAU 11445]
MLYKVANYLGERGQSLAASDDNALNQLSDSVFKENKHVGMALRALQKQRGGATRAGGRTLARVIAPAPLLPEELWRLRDDESTPPLPGQLFDQHSGSIEPNLFSSGCPAAAFFREFAPLIDDAPAPGGVDRFAGHMPSMTNAAALDFEYLPFSPGELRGLPDDEPVPSGRDQPVGNLLVSADPGAFIFNEEHMPPGELRRLLEDEPPSSAADRPPRRLPSELKDTSYCRRDALHSLSRRLKFPEKPTPHLACIERVALPFGEPASLASLAERAPPSAKYRPHFRLSLGVLDVSTPCRSGSGQLAGAQSKRSGSPWIKFSVRGTVLVPNPARSISISPP